MIWLGDKRGYATDWVTQRWVQLTGRRVQVQTAPWLLGPTGPTAGIGPEVIEGAAAAQGLVRARNQDGSGLIPDFSVLASDRFDPDRVAAPVRRFYEQTSRYEIDVWSQWKGLFHPFGRLLALLFSRRLQQLNVPLSPLDTSLGIDSQVVQYVQADSEQTVYTAWIRQMVGSGDVLYAAAYSTAEIPGQEGPCVKVVFPLPNGNAQVFMKPKLHPDGSLSVISRGARFGEPGFYFTVRADEESLWVRYLPTLQEEIRVYTSDGSVRADHELALWGADVLQLHYRLRMRGRD